MCGKHADDFEDNPWMEDVHTERGDAFYKWLRIGAVLAIVAGAAGLTLDYIF